MIIARRLLAAAAPLTLLALGACATPFRADVARFQQLPVPQGQTFVVQPANPDQSGLEFANYAGLVAQRLAQQGYRPVESRGDAQLVVSLDYGVDNGREKLVSRPDPYWGWGGWGGWGRGWGGYGRFGWRPFYYGWSDPFWGPGWGGSTVESYTYYTSFLEMRISRASDGQRLFEGRARARSADDKLTELVPNLVEAMFTNFPGRSGETVRITVPPPARTASR
jgi:hypothetical protein